jgi:predicted RNA-binding Zn-ribbon protein involved in translation (DUF1610 family)
MKHTQSNFQAARYLNLTIETYRKYAKSFVDQESGKNLYELHKNNSGKGIKKNVGNKIEINKITSRSGMRNRILRENLIPYKCDKCEISEWNGQKLSLHLDHIDGNAWNHELSNLRFLCPNCHSLTDTYTGKNK